MLLSVKLQILILNGTLAAISVIFSFCCQWNFTKSWHVNNLKSNGVNDSHPSRSPVKQQDGNSTGKALLYKITDVGFVPVFNYHMSLEGQFINLENLKDLGAEKDVLQLLGNQGATAIGLWDSTAINSCVCQEIMGWRDQKGCGRERQYCPALRSHFLELEHISPVSF